MIIIAKRPELIVPLSSAARVRGRFKIEAVNQGDGRRRVLADWFPNLITNGGLDMLGGSNPFLSTCAVGSGNTAPANTDTTLAALVGTTNSILTKNFATQSTAPYYGSTIYQYDFAAGTATGNLSEVGVGTSATALFSRALILDASGNPTTITVLSNESLYVTYQVQQYVPTVDVVGTVTIAGVNYSYTCRAANATAVFWALQQDDAPQAVYCAVSNGTIGAITGTISGTTATAGAYYPGTYTSGSYTLQTTLDFGLTNGNVAGGITALEVQFGSASSNGNRGYFQYGFGAAIPKDSSHTMTLVVSNSWARG